MTIYILIPKLSTNKKNHYFQIINLLKGFGLDILHNLDNSCKKYIEECKDDSYKVFPLTGMDAMIVDGSKLDFEIRYVIAFALSVKRPILYLIERGVVLPSDLRQLQRHRSIAKLLEIHYYTEQSLEKIIRKFLAGIIKSKLKINDPNFDLRPSLFYL